MTCINVIEMIGDTRTVKICPGDNGGKAAIHMKIEGSNPGGSIKDRAVAVMLA